MVRPRGTDPQGQAAAMASFANGKHKRLWLFDGQNSHECSKEVEVLRWSLQHLAEANHEHPKPVLGICVPGPKLQLTVFPSLSHKHNPGKDLG